MASNVMFPRQNVTWFNFLLCQSCGLSLGWKSNNKAVKQMCYCHSKTRSQSHKAVLWVWVTVFSTLKVQSVRQQGYSMSRCKEEEMRRRGEQTITKLSVIHVSHKRLGWEMRWRTRKGGLMGLTEVNLRLSCNSVTSPLLFSKTFFTFSSITCPVDCNWTAVLLLLLLVVLNWFMSLELHYKDPQTHSFYLCKMAHWGYFFFWNYTFSVYTFSSALLNLQHFKVTVHHVKWGNIQLCCVFSDGWKHIAVLSCYHAWCKDFNIRVQRFKDANMIDTLCHKFV